MTKEQIKIFLQTRPGLLNKPNYKRIAQRTNSKYEDVKQAIQEINDYYSLKIQRPAKEETYRFIDGVEFTKSEFLDFLNYKENQNRPIKRIGRNLPKPYEGDKNNVLVIGDLHAPFILEGYLEFCREQQEKYNCGTIVFIGDIIDGNSWSYHEHDADGMSVKTEVNRSIEQLKEWYQVFPEATVLLGNHDLLVARKAKTAGLSQMFIRDLGDILQAPKTWNFTHEFIKDNVKYIHGSIGNAIKRAKDERVSIVQGHLHTEAFIQYAVSEKDAIFGMQVGCGIDREAYAFEYAKPFPKKPVISCGIVLENGTLPIVKLMSL